MCWNELSPIKCTISCGIHFKLSSISHNSRDWQNNRHLFTVNYNMVTHLEGSGCIFQHIKICSVFYSLYSCIFLMKYIRKMKQTGDQYSAASNCLTVGGCMIRVVCFTLGSWIACRKVRILCRRYINIYVA